MSVVAVVFVGKHCLHIAYLSTFIYPRANWLPPGLARIILL